jgi:hypothetical protein
MSDFRFRLPPIAELTPAQQIAYNENGALMITGGPGSGKTVVSIYRFQRIMLDDQNGMFFTFNRTLMASVKGTFRQAAEIIFTNLTDEERADLINNKVASIFEWYGARFRAMLSDDSPENILRNFSTFIRENRNNIKLAELVIDESQDLHPKIIRNAHLLATLVSCGADRSQDLQGHYAPDPADDVIFELLPENTSRQELTRNFRNTKEIFEFARQFVPEDLDVQHIDTDELPEGEEPDLRGGLNVEAQNNLIKEIIEQNPALNIGILVHFKSQILTLKSFLEQNGYSCDSNAADASSFSYYFSGMPHADKNVMENRLRTPFILTFDSCKGLEFDIVIIPYFEKANWALANQRQELNDEGNWINIFNADGTPKMWATPNHYYVGATRTRRQLYILYDNKPNILGFHNEHQQDLFEDNLPF